MKDNDIPQLEISFTNEENKVLLELNKIIMSKTAGALDDTSIPIPSVKEYMNFRKNSAVLSLKSLFVSHLNKGTIMPINIIEIELESDSNEYKWLENLFKIKGYIITKLRKPTEEDWLIDLLLDIMREDIETDSKEEELHNHAIELEKTSGNIVYELSMNKNHKITNKEHEEKDDIISQNVYLKNRAKAIYNHIKDSISSTLKRGERLPLFILGPLIDDNDWVKFHQEFFEKGYIIDKPREPTLHEYKNFVVERILPRLGNLSNEEINKMMKITIKKAKEGNWVCYFVSLKN